MSYFAKPNFITYDEWFDYDLENSKLDIRNKKIKTISNIHEFFYEKSNYKVGGSENNIQLDIKLNEKELITNKYRVETLKKVFSVSNKKYRFFKKLKKSKIKLNFTKKIIYFLSIFGFLFILGFLLFFISQSKKNESNITNKSIFIEKGF